MNEIEQKWKSWKLKWFVISSFLRIYFLSIQLDVFRRENEVKLYHESSTSISKCDEIKRFQI